MKPCMVSAPKGRLLMIALTALPVSCFATDTVASDTSTHYEEVYHESGGSATVGGARVDYVTLAGTIMIEDRKSEPGALMSYVAYFRKNAGAAAKRPITFFYNGGPGSATVWLHLGAFGPKRVAVGDVRSVAAP
jgi:carboxypeptidase C (cathepsin A)